MKDLIALPSLPKPRRLRGRGMERQVWKLTEWQQRRKVMRDQKEEPLLERITGLNFVNDRTRESNPRQGR